MFTPKRLIRSALISIWFMILVFPIVGIRIIKRAPEFFYDRVLVIGAITQPCIRLLFSMSCSPSD